MQNKSKLLAVSPIVALALATLTPSLSAQTISITNPDFETGTSYPVVSGWDSDGNSGINNALPFGNALWVNGSAVVSQTTGATIDEGTTYKLTVDIGQQNLWPGGGGVIRLYGSDSGPSVALAEFDSGSLPASGDALLDQTTSFVATAGQDTGQFVGVALIGGGGTQVRFDNVRLEAIAPGGDTDPPILTSTDPANGETNVLASQDLVASFDETIQLTGAGSVTIKNLTDATDWDITLPNAQVTADGANLTINPTSDLDPGDHYAIRISGDALGDIATSQNLFPGISDDSTWNFTTDGTAPTLVSTNPADNTDEVPTAADLIATFSEDVQKGSGNIVITETGGPVFATIAVTSSEVTVSGAEVTINPVANLGSETDYHVEIAAGAIEDLSGNAFAGISGSSTWSFTTAAPGLVNPSFEEGAWGANAATHSTFNPVGWSSNPSAAFRPRASIVSLFPTDGSFQAWMNNGTYGYQDSGVEIVEGETYTLKVDFGPDQDNFPNIETVVIRLYGSDAGFGTAIAEITPDGPATTQWLTDQTVSFTASAGQATGQTLGVYLGVTAGTQVEWDNVRLEIGAVGGGSAFDDWADSAGLDGTAGKEDGQGDDPDNGGGNNLFEFAFGGDPLDGNDDGSLMNYYTSDVTGGAEPEFLLTVLVRAGATFTDGAPATSAPIDGIVYSIGGSGTLPVDDSVSVSESGTVVATGLPPAPSGYEYKTFILDGSTATLPEGYLQATVAPSP